MSQLTHGTVLDFSVFWHCPKTGTRGDLPIVQTGMVPSSAKYTCTGIQTGGQGGEMGNRTWLMISAGSVPEFCVFLSN